MNPLVLSKFTTELGFSGDFKGRTLEEATMASSLENPSEFTKQSTVKSELPALIVADVVYPKTHVHLELKKMCWTLLLPSLSIMSP